MFLASVDSAILAKGLSAPQHSTYFVILLEGRDLVGGPPGVAAPVPERPKSPTRLLFLSEIVDKRGLAFPFCDSEIVF